VKDGDDFELRAPIGGVILDRLKMENRSREIAFECQGADAEHCLHVRQFRGNVDVQRFF
jgi:hypothetical protein